VTSAEAQPRSPGRPRDAQKREQILDAALRLFRTQGFSNTTMEGVAAAADVAKLTVYRNFPGKMDLFAAVMEERQPPHGDFSVLADPDVPFETGLRRWAVEFVRAFRHRDMVAHDRILSADTVGDPELARAFFDRGPYRIRALLAGALRRAGERGEVRPLADDAAERAAGALLALLFGFEHFEQRFGVGTPPDEDEVAQQVDHALDLFFNGLRSR
jgi:TetR/AcrR family transcriptional repressor of mexJK operon